MPLNERQARFVAEYLVDLNATAAAVRAGYSVATANRVGPRLLSNVGVAAAIAEAQAARAKRTEVTADRVVLELARIAFGDPRRVMSWGPGGVKLRPSAELADEDAAIVAEVGETTTKEGGTLRVKTVDKLGALRLLGQHLGMFAEKVDMRATVSAAPELAALQAMLLRVLDRHPDAKRAVVAALEAAVAEEPAGHA
jgi:phage terminase small subunit